MFLWFYDLVFRRKHLLINLIGWAPYHMHLWHNQEAFPVAWDAGQVVVKYFYPLSHISSRESLDQVLSQHKDLSDTGNSHGSSSCIIQMGPGSSLVSLYFLWWFLILWLFCATKHDFKITELVVPEFHLKPEAYNSITAIFCASSTLISSIITLFEKSPRHSRL